MGGGRSIQAFTALVMAASLIAGCSPRVPRAAEETVTPLPPQVTASPAPTATPTPPPTHRLGVRAVNGVGEFYDRLTGEKFVPRGSNYIRTAEQQSPSGDSMIYHSTFNVGLYDPAQAEEALQRMQADGYNVVRVFIQGNCKDDCIGNPAGGLSEVYVANVADFLQKAKAHDIYTILTTDNEPSTKYYIDLLDTTWSEQFGGTNTFYLRGGGILIAKQFWTDLVEALAQQGAPLDAVFAYELRNELFFETNAPPFTLSSGMVSTANGKSYDMASAADRQTMMDEGAVYWLNSTRAEILKADPTALVSAGFFWPQAPNPARIGDPRFIETAPILRGANLDFFDLHPYPGWELTFPQYVENFGMAGIQEKPIILGEFGASRSSYRSASSAAKALQDWQIQSCEYGFDGWLVWTWDGGPATNFYNALDGNGEANAALAPAKRADPCQP